MRSKNVRRNQLNHKFYINKIVSQKLFLIHSIINYKKKTGQTKLLKEIRSIQVRSHKMDASK